MGGCQGHRMDDIQYTMDNFYRRFVAANSSIVHCSSSISEGVVSAATGDNGARELLSGEGGHNRGGGEFGFFGKFVGVARALFKGVYDQRLILIMRGKANGVNF